MKRFLLALLAIGIAISLLVGLPTTGAEPKTTALDAGDPIKVGVFVDLTGQTASFGVATVNGIKLAAEEINAAGGIDGRPIKLVVADDQGYPNGAANAVRGLIERDHVVAVLGEVASTNSLAAAPIAQAAKVPMISPASTHPLITQVGDYIFRACFIDPFQGTAMARFARNTLKAKTAAIFGDVNSDYSKGLARTFKSEFGRLGGLIVAESAYTQTDADFRGQLRAIRARKPDVIYVPGYYSQAGVIAKQARKLGLKQPFLGGDGWDSPRLFELAGTALNGSFITNHYAEADPLPTLQKFKADYLARFKEEPDALAALGYDAMHILADAMMRAGTTEGAKLRDAIARTTNFPGVTGNITLDAERNAIKPAVILEVRDGRFVYKETVAPGAERAH